MSEASRSACPCGSRLAYAECCGPLHDGAAAPDAAALMRSRYSAYVLAIEAYLLATWHPSTRPARIDPDGALAPQWLGLQVRRHVTTGPASAIVEFVARYCVGGRAQRLHEVSHFVQQAGRWYYVDGEFPAATGESSAGKSPAATIHAGRKGNASAKSASGRQ
ncbi:YchJ family metal-binding protein [Candidatus Accumulibacter sp. ACC007]|uniref:YchJ family protein n=1 Tax=Candidatus Accumulibacter sp. ACC007 TaxID=2823333 RepID=UPI00341BB39D